jgi:hypothetical protein
MTMDPSGFATSGLGMVGLGCGAFMAIMLCFSKFIEMRRADATQVGILEKDRAHQLERAARAEEKMEGAWQTLNAIQSDFTKVQVQNAALAEEVRYLREENLALRSRVEDFMRTHK